MRIGLPVSRIASTPGGTAATIVAMLDCGVFSWGGSAKVVFEVVQVEEQFWTAREVREVKAGVVRNIVPELQRLNAGMAMVG